MSRDVASLFSTCLCNEFVYVHMHKSQYRVCVTSYSSIQTIHLFGTITLTLGTKVSGYSRLDCTPLTRVSSVRYLGLQICSDLSWSTHVCGKLVY